MAWTLPTPAVTAALLLAAVLGTSSAQTSTPYKVVGPDGKVTYTDRPTPGDSRATPVGAAGSATTPTDIALPLELRQAVNRYPVTLYVAVDDCDPCRAGRELLRQRGIPFAERQVLTQEDSQALERVSGGSQVPVLGIGAQILRGLSPEAWNSYLDAAAYPRESRLPANYQYPAATPLVVRAAPQPLLPPSAPVDAPATLPNLPGAAGIRF